MEQLYTIPSISLILSPMCSGKSTELIRRLSIYSAMGLKVVYINSNLDTRGEHFSTHNACITNLGSTHSIKVHSLSESNTSEYDIIGIDEAQFFDDLKEFVLDQVETHNKIVIVAGLNGDYRRNVFGKIIELIPFCDSITKLSSFCYLCNQQKIIKPAHFTKRINDACDDQIVIGGYDTYFPVCRKCYIS